MSFLKVSGKKTEIPKPLGGIRFEQRPGGWLIAHLPSGDRVKLALAQVKNKLSFNIGGRSFHTEIQDQSRGISAHSGTAADLSAQFPGKVRKILAADGTSVKAGEPIVLVEAMKMEFQIKAPSDGTVLKVLVIEGQQLSPGDLLVDFKADQNG